MELKIEQFDELEIAPNVVVAVAWIDATAIIDEDGRVQEIHIAPLPNKDDGVVLWGGDADHHKRFLFCSMRREIERHYKVQLAEHADECLALYETPDPNYGRLLPQEMR